MVPDGVWCSGWRRINYQSQLMSHEVTKRIIMIHTSYSNWTVIWTKMTLKLWLLKFKILFSKALSAFWQRVSTGRRDHTLLDTNISRELHPALITWYSDNNGDIYPAQAHSWLFLANLMGSHGSKMTKRGNPSPSPVFRCSGSSSMWPF